MIIDLVPQDTVVMSLGQWRCLVLALYGCYAVVTSMLVWRACDAVCRSKLVARLCGNEYIEF